MFRVNLLLQSHHSLSRLTPCVAFTMVLWMFVLPRFAHGPLTHQLSDPNSTCRAHWWTNLLYVQNFYPTHLDDVVSTELRATQKRFAANVDFCRDELD